MKMMISSELEITDYDGVFADWCESNLYVDNPEYNKKLRMGFWVGNTPKRMALYHKNGDKIYIPRGLANEVVKVFPQECLKVDFNDDKQFILLTTNSIPLYDYQKKAVEVMQGKSIGILQSAAGSGKTQMALSLICQKGYKALWLTHTKDLLEQSYKRAAQYMPKEWLGKITDGKVDIGEGITFATVQTMCKLDPEIYKNEFNAIVVDECHRVSGTPTKVTQFSKVLNNIKARYKYGVSATVHRSDGLIRCTEALLGSVKYIVPNDAVREKIMPVKIVKRKINTPASDEYLDGSGMISYTHLIEYLMKCKERQNMIAADINKNSDRHCLVLSDRISHLEELRRMIESRRTALITGKTAQKSRNEAIEKMKKGEINVLFATYNLAKEGLDIPNLDRLFLTTPHKDYAVTVQAVGRIARISEGKEDAVCYDYVDENIGYCKRAYAERCRHYKKARCVL